MGHNFNVAGERKQQDDEIVSDFHQIRLNALILPLIMKLEAVRQTALVKVQQWTGLNTHTTRDITFYTKQEGGVGCSQF